MADGPLAPDAIRRHIAQLVCPLPAQLVPLLQANGLVLVQPMVAACDLPRFANSAMDGFALRWAETSATQALSVVGRSLAGVPWRATLEPGEAVVIATGAMLPNGADTVVPLEDAWQEGDRVLLSAPVKRGQHVRWPGEDIRAGEVVLPAGTLLGPNQLAAAAGLGLSELLVRPRPRVAVIPTGDEVRSVGTPLGPGEIYDAISVPLKILVEDAGALALLFAPVKDEPEALLAALRDAARRADLILSAGGVSVGERDLIGQLAGSVAVASVSVAVRPARPFAFGSAYGKPLLALPGNPAAALASFEEFGRPAIRALMGKPPAPRATLSAILRGPLAGDSAALRLVRVQVWREGSDLWAVSAGSQGAGMLHSLARANGWAVIPAGAGPLAAATTVQVRMVGELGEGPPAEPTLG